MELPTLLLRLQETFLADYFLDKSANILLEYGFKIAKDSL
jgi:hypothetical protein